MQQRISTRNHGPMHSVNSSVHSRACWCRSPASACCSSARQSRARCAWWSSCERGPAIQEPANAPKNGCEDPFGTQSQGPVTLSGQRHDGEATQARGLLHVLSRQHALKRSANHFDGAIRQARLPKDCVAACSVRTGVHTTGRSKAVFHCVVWGVCRDAFLFCRIPAWSRIA